MPFGDVAASYLASDSRLWATGEESVRARSFVVIHKLCSLDPKKLLALTLKGMYLTYVRHTKTSNPTALPRINFFVACITDIYGLDMELSYQHAFMSIRQLAVTLRPFDPWIVGPASQLRQRKVILKFRGA